MARARKAAPPKLAIVWLVSHYIYHEQLSLFGCDRISHSPNQKIQIKLVYAMPSNSSTTEAAAQAAVAARRAALEAERQAAEARPSVGALRVWLGAVAAMRFFSVVVGYIDVSYLQRGVFDLQPDQGERRFAAGS